MCAQTTNNTTIPLAVCYVFLGALQSGSIADFATFCGHPYILLKTKKKPTFRATATARVHPHINQTSSAAFVGVDCLYKYKYLLPSASTTVPSCAVCTGTAFCQKLPKTGKNGCFGYLHYFILLIIIGIIARKQKRTQYVSRRGWPLVPTTQTVI